MKYRDFTNYEVYPFEDKVVNLKNGKELKQSTNDRGYKCYRLYKDGKVFSIRTNRLYYECVNGEIPKGMEIDHIDNNRGNNHPSNLRAVSHTENMNNPISLNVRKEVLSNYELRKHHSEVMKGKFSGEKNPMYGKPKSAITIQRQYDSHRHEMKPVVQKDLDGNIITTYFSIHEATRRTGVNRYCINACLSGKQKSSKGFICEYANSDD